MEVTMTLTDVQYAQLLADADDKKDMLTKEELKEIAEKLNKKINVPLIGEEKEHKILYKIVRNVDRFLYSKLPNELYATIRDTENGLTDEEAENITARLTKLINKKINIPYLTESMEHIAINFVLGVLLNALRKSKTLEAALADAA